MTGGASETETIYILDIDGTLLRTHEIDNSCYWDAIEKVFGPQNLNRQLLDYLHVSDSGILEQWCNQALGRAPHPAETRELRSLFLVLMEEQARQQPELFEPREGLLDWLEAKHAEPGTRLAIATGSWGNTARFKLRVSGLDRYGMTMATGDDAICRTDIMNTAFTRLSLATGPDRHRITYIGDGPWDYRASMELGWSFIGIADGPRAARLRELGAQQVHRDFLPLLNGTEP